MKISKNSKLRPIFLIASSALLSFFGLIEIENGLAKDSDDWRKVPVKCYLDKEKTIRYCETESENHSKVSFVVTPINKNVEIKPVVNRITCATSEAAEKEGAVAGVNAGFFNLHGGSSRKAGGVSSGEANVGYITINGQLICTPKDNTALVQNPKLQPFLKAILDRSELRFIADSKGKIVVKIQPHSEPIPEGFTLKHAIQAGPRLLPEITDEQEAFLRTNADGTTTDSIGCLKTAARTAFGITDDGHYILLCVAGPKNNEFSAGVSLAQLADLMKSLGCLEAINFDGGTSTTMVIKDESNEDRYKVVCGLTPERNVKSCLIIRLNN
jgi:hypothetical protein